MKLGSAAVVAGLALELMSGTAKAAYIIDIYQSGSDVVAYGVGFLNTTDLSLLGVGSAGEVLYPAHADVRVGSGDDAVYGSINGPNSFGSSSGNYYKSSTGQVVGVVGFSGELYVPAGYVSGRLLAPSTADYGAGTLAGFGVDMGTYVFSWGTGANADTLTVNVGLTPPMSAVPLPASAPLFGAGFLALGAAGYAAKRKKAATTA